MKTTRIQGIGMVEAKKAEDLKVGETTLWNFGEKAIVNEIVKETAKTITLDLDGWVQRFNKTRLIAII